MHNPYALRYNTVTESWNHKIIHLGRDLNKISYKVRADCSGLYTENPQG